MRRKIRRYYLAFFDVLIINLAVILALALRYDFNIPSVQLDEYLTVAMILTIGKIFIYHMFSLYDSIWEYASIEELIRIVFAVAVSSSFGTAYLLMQGTSMKSSVMIMICLLEMAGISSTRFSYRVIRRFKNKRSIFRQDSLKNVLIIGAGATAGMIAKEMQERPEIHGLLKGYIDDADYLHNKYINGAKVLGNRHDIYSVVNRYKIDEIIVAIPSADKKTTKEIMEECSRCNCKVKTAPGIHEIIDGKVSMNQIRDVEIEDLLGRDPVKLDMSGISSYLTDKVVMVTGGGGSIGSELCRQIAKFDPMKLIILDIYENNAYEIQNELSRQYKDKLNILTLIASVRDQENIENIFQKYKPDVIFHAAAHKHVPLMETAPREAILNNCFGTLNVAKAADKFNAERFVLISTDKAVNPTNVMGASKRICEMIIQSIAKQSETKFTGVRFGNVLGSNGSVVPLFKRQIEEGGPVTVTHKDVIRYFMTIPEAAQLVLQSGAYARGGEIFVLDMGEPVSIYKLAHDLIRLSGLKPNEDIEIKITGLRPGEKLYEELLMKEEGLTKTNNEKIFIGKPESVEYKMLLKSLSYLSTIIQENNNSTLRMAIRNLVPTYKMNDETNREFMNRIEDEKMDQEFIL
ncbi:MAG: polysaccharide biosynthesis protein [Clostridia bacterium]|nr:polysaccharide biosynthesis protein [Clostridia bacterium]